MINNDFRQARLAKDDIKACFSNLKSAEDGAVVHEGQHGGGAGMTCHQFTGGTGTSSRVVGNSDNGGKHYTLAALCQSNYGLRRHLSIGGIPIGKILIQGGVTTESSEEQQSTVPSKTKDGSIVILIVTDAPLTTTQLDRVARHATAGLAMVGGHGIGRNSSGDIFVALSTADHGPELVNDFEDREVNIETYNVESVKNECINPFFYACAEAVEEAVLNSMVGAAGKLHFWQKLFSVSDADLVVHRY
jgi:D-aminopeptidase